MATGKPGRAVRGDLYRSQPLRRRAPVSRRSPAFDRPPEIRRKVDVQRRRGFGPGGSVVRGFGRGRRVRTSLRGFGRRRGSNDRVSRETGPARTGVSASSLRREPREGKASVELPRGSSRSVDATHRLECPRLETSADMGCARIRPCATCGTALGTGDG